MSELAPHSVEVSPPAEQLLHQTGLSLGASVMQHLQLLGVTLFQVLRGRGREGRGEGREGRGRGKGVRKEGGGEGERKKRGDGGREREDICDDNCH